MKIYHYTNSTYNQNRLKLYVYGSPPLKRALSSSDHKVPLCESAPGKWASSGSVGDFPDTRFIDKYLAYGHNIGRWFFVFFFNLYCLNSPIQDRWPPKMSTNNSSYRTLLIKLWSLFPLPLHPGWPRDQLWPTGCTGGAPDLAWSLNERSGSFFCFLADQPHRSQPDDWMRGHMQNVQRERGDRLAPRQQQGPRYRSKIISDILASNEPNVATGVTLVDPTQTGQLIQRRVKNKSLLVLATKFWSSCYKAIEIKY